jgi:hypothetical protein
MFKYISEILQQFNTTQRILVLFLVLSSIVMITLGPSLISSRTETCDELKETVEYQKTELSNRRREIINLNKDVDTLNMKLRIQRKECSDEVIKLENELLDMIRGVEHKVTRMNNSSQIITRTDTSLTIDTIRIINPAPVQLMNDLKLMRKKVENDIEKRNK